MRNKTINCESAIIQFGNRKGGWFSFTEVASNIDAPKTEIMKAIHILKATRQIESTFKNSRVKVYRVKVKNDIRTHSAKITGKPYNIFDEIIIKGHDEDFRDRTPSSATGYLPGTDEKRRVMRARIQRGESPFHPDDAGCYKSCSERRPRDPWSEKVSPVEMREEGDF